jgi:hypothetical protein
METLPAELSDAIIGQHLNCTQAHAFLSQYFLRKKSTKTEEDILKEEEVWTRVGEIHFPEQGVSSSSTFADLCSKRNQTLSKALDEILKTVFDCIDFIYNEYKDETLDMGVFEEFETLQSNYEIYTYIKKYSSRRFIVDYQDSLYKLVSDVCYFAQEHEDSYEMIAISEQSGNYKIGKFVEMFRHNSNLFVPTQEPSFESDETEPEKLKRKIWYQYPEIPDFITDVYDLLQKPEDSIYISHLYLTGQWIDEVTLSSETLRDSTVAEMFNEEFIKILPVLGKLVMKYVERNNLEDNEWLNDYTLGMEQNERLSLKQRFREGIVTTHANGRKIPDFSTNYLIRFSAQQWADILVSEDGPHWCFDEQTLTDNNVIESFLLSIRYKSLQEWFEHN